MYTHRLSTEFKKILQDNDIIGEKDNYFEISLCYFVILVFTKSCVETISRDAWILMREVASTGPILFKPCLQ